MKYKFGDRVQLYNFKKGFVFPTEDGSCYFFIEEAVFNDPNRGSLDTLPRQFITDANIRTIL